MASQQKGFEEAAIAECAQCQSEPEELLDRIHRQRILTGRVALATAIVVVGYFAATIWILIAPEFAIVALSLAAAVPLLITAAILLTGPRRPDLRSPASSNCRHGLAVRNVHARSSFQGMMAGLSVTVGSSVTLFLGLVAISADPSPYAILVGVQFPLAAIFLTVGAFSFRRFLRACEDARVTLLEAR